jgi:hypothetical protein
MSLRSMNEVLYFHCGAHGFMDSCNDEEARTRRLLHATFKPYEPPLHLLLYAFCRTKVVILGLSRRFVITIALTDDRPVQL